MAATLVQSASEYPPAGDTTFPGASTSGNRIVNSVNSNDSVATLDGLAAPKTVGGAVSLTARPAFGLAGSVTALKFWELDNAASTTGVTPSLTANDIASQVFEISGTLGGAFDSTAWTASQKTAGTGTSIASNSFSPVADSFALGFFADEVTAQASITPGGSWLTAQQQLGHVDHEQYLASTGTSAQTMPLTLATASNNNWILGVACWAVAAGGATAWGPLLGLGNNRLVVTT